MKKKRTKKKKKEQEQEKRREGKKKKRELFVKDPPGELQKWLSASIIWSVLKSNCLNLFLSIEKAEAITTLIAWCFPQIFNWWSPNDMGGKRRWIHNRWCENASKTLWLAVSVDARHAPIKHVELVPPLLFRKVATEISNWHLIFWSYVKSIFAPLFENHANAPLIESRPGNLSHGTGVWTKDNCGCT